MAPPVSDEQDSADKALMDADDADGGMTESGFLQRVGRSIKSLFGCVNRPRLDPDSHYNLQESEHHHHHHERQEVKKAEESEADNVAHSWVTQATSFAPFPILNHHQSLIIDLPPPLSHVLFLVVLHDTHSSRFFRIPTLTISIKSVWCWIWMRHWCTRPFSRFPHPTMC